MTDKNTIRISDACRTLHIAYDRMYRAIASGQVPAERDASGHRWLMKLSDLDDIAKIMGVSPPAKNASTPVSAGATLTH